MKKNNLFSFVMLAVLVQTSGMAHAVGTITGITSIPANPVPGEPAKFKISTTGSGECGMRLVYGVMSGGASEPSDNMLVNTKPAGGGVMDKTIAKAGIYKLKAIGSPSLNPKCNGEADLIVYVNGKPAPAAGEAKGKPGAAASLPATTPAAKLAIVGSIVMSEETICPTPYVKYTQGLDISKGESICVKSDATCQDSYSSHRNPDNGQLTCTPKLVPDAPAGWKPGTGGNLVFDSIPQPMIKCPKSTPDWQWGTSYRKDGWNRMGCYANSKIAS